MSACLNENQVLDLLEGRVAEDAREAMDAHLADCESCREMVVETARFVAPDEQEETSGAGESVMLARGAAVGRYVIEDVVGVGAMGAVYAARDPQLKRRVALKLLHREGDARLHERLLREAQTMGRLAHPNIVAVHDVGTLRDQVFLVMELVEGRTLAQWLREEERGWRKTLDVFVQAGRGLAAAHAAGVVHRDFKPENVLVRRDGRVQVTDFGLARDVIGEEGSGGPDGDPDARLLGDETPESAQLTRTGALVGTPAYMAPEQIEGRASDARTDQFSFCVALHEALHGKRPFEGDSWDELRSSVLDGRLSEIATRRSVPNWVRRPVLRGLSTDPDARYPSMQALLHALSRDPRRRLLGVAAVLLFLGLVAALVVSWQRGRRPRQCAGAGGEVAAIWNDAARTKIAGAFEKVGKRWAPEVWLRMRRSLDAYAQRWARMRREACEATHERGVQSASLLDLRMACLDQRLVSLAEVSALFSKADHKTVLRATRVVRGLPDVVDCAATKKLRQRIAPPPKEQRDRVAALGRRLARARVLYDAGKYLDSKRLATTLVAEARTLGYRPLLAEALHRLGLAQARIDPKPAEKPLVEAFHLAQGCRHDELAAAVSTFLVSLVGYRLERKKDGLGWARHAKSAIDRIGGDPLLSARRLSSIGLVFASSNPLKSLELQRRALALRLKHAPKDDFGLVSSFNNIGVSLLDLGRWEEALRTQEQALRARERALGTAHPLVSQSRVNYAFALSFNYRFAAAQKALDAAIRVYERTFGRNYSGLWTPLNGLGQILTLRGRYAEAQRVLERCLRLVRQRRKGSFVVAMPLHGLGDLALKRARLREAERWFREAMKVTKATLGAAHPVFALHITGLGMIAFARGRYRKALAYFKKTVAIREKKLGSKNSQVAISLILIGRTYLRLKQTARAMASFQRANAIQEKGRSSHHPDTAESLTGIAEVHLARGHPKVALDPLRRALALQSKGRGDPQARAWTRFVLARALWRAGGDTAQALPLAEEAQAIYKKIPVHAFELGRVRKWLRSRR